MRKRFLIWLAALWGLWLFANMPRDAGSLKRHLQWAGCPWTFAHWEGNKLEWFDGQALAADLGILLALVPLAFGLAYSGSRKFTFHQRNVSHDMIGPPLKPLHDDRSLIYSKLARYRRLSTESLCESLLPDREGSLKVRPVGTMLDGHHRIYVLRERGVDVDALPRLVIPKDSLSESG